MRSVLLDIVAKGLIRRRIVAGEGLAAAHWSAQRSVQGLPENYNLWGGNLGHDYHVLEGLVESQSDWKGL